MSSKKIRDLKRLLQSKSKDDPLGISQIEKKLSDLLQEKENNITKEKERRHATKYHMVKFFERRKITRIIRKIDSSMSSYVGSNEGLSQLQSLRNLHEDDLTYVLYYPKDWKYISLFAKEDDQETNIRQKKRIQEARELARALRTREVSQGDVDRVQHAIDLEKGDVVEPLVRNIPHTSTKTILEIDAEKTKKRKRDASNVSDAGTISMSRKKEQHVTQTSSQAISEEDEEEEEEDVDEGGRMTGMNENENSDDHENEEDADGTDASEAEADQPSFVRGKSSGDGQPQPNKPPQMSKKTTTTQRVEEEEEEVFSPDPFFLEEAPSAAPGSEAAATHTHTGPFVGSKSRHIGPGAGTGGHSQGRVGQGVRSGSLRTRPMSASNALTKQEMRLHVWQMKVRARGVGGSSVGGRPTGGRRPMPPPAAVLRASEGDNLQRSRSETAREKVVRRPTPPVRAVVSQKNNNNQQYVDEGANRRNKGVIDTASKPANKRKTFNDDE